LKIFSRITGQEKLKFTRKLYHIVKKRKFVKIMAPGGGGNCFYMCLYRENIFKIFFTRTTGLEKLKFTGKLSDRVQKQVC
jgi:hypothetical protein